jgi:hypothetical protein
MEYKVRCLWPKALPVRASYYGVTTAFNNFMQFPLPEGGPGARSIQVGKAVAPFVVSFFLLAMGAGLFKPNVAPLVVDQDQ